jgi:putative oxidoreductase
MPNSARNIAALVGRMLICWIFIYSAWGQIVEFQFWANRATQKGLPGAAAIVASITIQMVGGIAVLIGAQTEIASLVLFVFLVPTTLIFHDFWTVHGAARDAQIVNFNRNVAILGGLLFVSMFGAGEYSVDAMRARRHKRWTALKGALKGA